jgi:transposase-like protein
MDHKIQVRKIYDDAFKRKLIQEYLETGCCKMDLIRKYNIHFKSAIQTWMRRLGYADSHRSKKIKFGRIITSQVANTTSLDGSTDLQKKIRQLERQLEDEKLRVEAYQRIIEKAEQELKISIRKKPNTK